MTTITSDGYNIGVILMSAWNEPIWLLGDTFIRDHYLVYNYGNKSISIDGAERYWAVLILAMMAVLI